MVYHISLPRWSTMPPNGLWAGCMAGSGTPVPHPSETPVMYTNSHTLCINVDIPQLLTELHHADGSNNCNPGDCAAACCHSSPGMKTPPGPSSGCHQVPLHRHPGNGYPLLIKASNQNSPLMGRYPKWRSWLNYDIDGNISYYILLLLKFLSATHSYTIQKYTYLWLNHHISLTWKCGYFGIGTPYMYLSIYLSIYLYIYIY